MAEKFLESMDLEEKIIAERIGLPLEVVREMKREREAVKTI